MEDETFVLVNQKEWEESGQQEWGIERCDHCGGTGKFWDEDNDDWDECGLCKGTGWLHWMVDGEVDQEDP